MAERLTLDPSAPRTARELVGRFEEQLDPASFWALRQVVGEMLAACVESVGAASVMLRVRRTERDVGVEVSFTSDPAVRVSRGVSEEAPHAAIAFRLVDRIAHRWGVRDDGACTTVWVLISHDPDGFRSGAEQRLGRGHWFTGR